MNFFTNLGRVLKVYRGQQITTGEYAQWKKNRGKLVSINSFVSTTEDRQVALMFSGSGQCRPEQESVIFEISIDTSLTNCIPPFANISHVSAIADEGEILLAMGTVYRIESFDEIEDRITRIRLSVCPRDEKQFDQFKKIISNIHPLVPFEMIDCRYESGAMLTLTFLLLKMGERRKAIVMYNMAQAQFILEQRVDPVFEYMCRSIKIHCDSVKALLSENDTMDFLRQMASGEDQQIAAMVVPDLVSLITEIASCESIDEVDPKNFEERAHLAMQPLSSMINLEVFLQSVGFSNSDNGQNKSVLNSQTITRNELQHLVGCNHFSERGSLLDKAQEAEKCGRIDLALDFYLRCANQPDSSNLTDLLQSATANVKIVKILLHQGELEIALQFANNVLNMREIPPQSDCVKIVQKMCVYIYTIKRDWAKARESQARVVDFLENERITTGTTSLNLESERNMLHYLQMENCQVLEAFAKIVQQNLFSSDI